MLSRRFILLALATLPALPVMAWAQSAEDIRKRVMATPVFPVETYVDYVRKSGVKLAYINEMNSTFSRLDSLSRVYFAYIVNPIIKEYNMPNEYQALSVISIANILSKQKSPAGDIGGIKDFVDDSPSSKVRFFDLVELPEYRTSGENTPLGVIGFYVATNRRKIQ